MIRALIALYGMCVPPKHILFVYLLIFSHANAQQTMSFCVKRMELFVAQRVQKSILDLKSWIKHENELFRRGQCPPFAIDFLAKANVDQRQEFRLMINLTMVINITFARNLFVPKKKRSYFGAFSNFCNSKKTIQNEKCPTFRLKPNGFPRQRFFFFGFAFSAYDPWSTLNDA